MVIWLLNTSNETSSNWTIWLSIKLASGNMLESTVSKRTVGTRIFILFCTVYLTNSRDESLLNSVSAIWLIWLLNLLYITNPPAFWTISLMSSVASLTLSTLNSSSELRMNFLSAKLPFDKAVICLSTESADATSLASAAFPFSSDPLPTRWLQATDNSK